MPWIDFSSELIERDKRKMSLINKNHIRRFFRHNNFIASVTHVSISFTKLMQSNYFCFILHRRMSSLVLTWWMPNWQTKTKYSAIRSSSPTLMERSQIPLVKVRQYNWFLWFLIVTGNLCACSEVEENPIYSN